MQRSPDVIDLVNKGSRVQSDLDSGLQMLLYARWMVAQCGIRRVWYTAVEAACEKKEVTVCPGRQWPSWLLRQQALCQWSYGN